MDAIGSYYSDEEPVRTDSQPKSQINNVETEPLTAPSQKGLPLKADTVFPTGSAPTSNFANVETMDLDAISESCSSRVHSSYQRSRLTSVQDHGSITNDSTVSNTLKATSLVVSDPSTTNVISVELGSRNNETGIVSIAASEADTAPIETQSDRIRANMESVAVSRMKSHLREHTRDDGLMGMANYPVDHPMHRNISLIDRNELERYGKGGNSLALNGDTGSGVFVTPCGLTEKTYFDETSFDDQIRQGDLMVSMAHLGANDLKRRRRLSESEMESEDIFGPWLPYEEFDQPAADVPSAETSDDAERRKLPTFEANTRKMPHAGLAFPNCTPDVALPLNEVIVEDGKQETRYDGVAVSSFHRKIDPNSPPMRSWLLPPKNLKAFDPDNYKSRLPKQEIHTYTGHTMAVQALRYIPRTGHCLLSASMDGFVKIWDANNNRKCLRTYKGHCKGVKDIAFANADGTKFYSCGYDSNVIQWDTEYGKVVGVYNMEAAPFCVTVYPCDENIFIVGGASKKASQYDARSGKVSLEYNAHQSNVNTVTFFDENRRLVTTGDDRRMAVWEYNIPVAIKQLSDPSMHSMPAVVAHPSEKFILAQAMSNQILVYESSGSRFRFFGGKRFKGHLCSGYAIRPSCSPDGRYVVSGDARGRVFLWDWKTCRNISTLSGHKSVTMDCQWHPLQPSRIATCSWDGTIKLWD
ncbi:WD domain G-beta repeat family protein [Babesia bovis T2Bo]|uniref:Pre-mRNA-processing factor 17 n=1 Tax=Babesia bovis TaxID=5865 RepID=A7ANG7_BABBO|nr:WD domain G-beta repeat family protein [Babesia bovis T2Bo]EDO08101.1 WD domain G-beta repeat family protein [Babesia bovis T2Bo]|eukprot:XP_001611669.1 WD domain, G-beta repeat containing protein [Babesia bovis T2Bo]